MFEATKPLSSADAASAFIISAEMPSLRPDIWAEAGHAIELASREPASIGQATRVAVAIALIVGVKLCAAVMLG